MREIKRDRGIGFGVMIPIVVVGGGWSRKRERESRDGKEERSIVLYYFII